VAWRGIVDPARLSERFLKEIFRRYTFFFPRAGHFASFPLIDTIDTDGSRRQSFRFLWYDHIADGEPLNDLLTEDDGVLHEYSISPHRIRREHIEKIRARAHDELPGILAEIVEATDSYLLQPIYDVLSDRMGFQSVALVGDAAFVVRPHVGTDVLKAGEDALTLADCLDAHRNIADALAAFESLRLPFGRDSVLFARATWQFHQQRPRRTGARSRLPDDATGDDPVYRSAR
jgi:2-polyprenyl-6-methoxyphenol hydroxylase-like FAD-dependent oxidoreductase